MIKIQVQTRQRTQFVDVTQHIQDVIAQFPAWNGLLHVYSPHTTAAITVNEHADTDVARDMEAAFDRLIPWQADYAHIEGNSAAHIKSTLVGVSAFVPVANGHLKMGTWQGIFFCEFDGPRARTIHLTPIKDLS